MHLSFYTTGWWCGCVSGQSSSRTCCWSRRPPFFAFLLQEVAIYKKISKYSMTIQRWWPQQNCGEKEFDA